MTDFVRVSTMYAQKKTRKIVLCIYLDIQVYFLCLFIFMIN